MIPETTSSTQASTGRCSCLPACAVISGFRVTALLPCALAGWAGPCGGGGIRCHATTAPCRPVPFGLWVMAKESELAPLDVGGLAGPGRRGRGPGRASQRQGPCRGIFVFQGPLT